MSKYVFGIDFGTLSARAVLVEAATGKTVAEADKKYAHGVMDTVLPDGTTRLPPDWALHHPMDYIDCIADILPRCMRESGVSANDIIGVGLDVTCCTMLPVDEAATPLCELGGLEHEPHAYMKLWKHHAAQREADMITLAAARHGAILERYGGKISSEWMFPKIWQILNEAPMIYERAHRFIEAADWLILMLTGEESRSSCMAGYKALWQKESGYPDDAFFKSLDARLEHVVDEKLSRKILPLGSIAGYITEKSAGWCGLAPKTPVAVGASDAHAAVLGCGIARAGALLMVAGTSGCDMMVSNRCVPVPGICGVCADGILPGFFGYEAGQSCMGDHFDWCVRTCATDECRAAAEKAGMSIFKWFDTEAEKLSPGESGLLALDWWNGNRSVLKNDDLSGLMAGFTLTTTPVEIYRALIEAVAFGKRRIIENFIENGVEVNELFAAGGISQKSPVVMQILADVLNRPIKVCSAKNASAMGSAAFAAAAAGKARGGFESVAEAAAVFGGGISRVYEPDEKHAAVYELLYAEFCRLHDHFGLNDPLMKTLKGIKAAARAKNSEK